MTLYLSGVAGYASSADRLGRRSQTELKAANQFLLRPFFEKHPEYAPYRSKITEQGTPDLFRALDIAELDRRDLRQEVERLLQRVDEVQPNP